jgi:hypothetical protein
VGQLYADGPKTELNTNVLNGKGTSTALFIPFPLKMWPTKMNPVDFDQGAAMRNGSKRLPTPF